VASSRFSFGEFQRGIGAKLLIAPFGASCVLVFAIPQSHLAQPRNVIGGHLISAGAGLSVFCARAGSGSAVSMAGVAKIVAPKGGGKARIREVLIPEEAAPQFLDDAAPRNGMMSPPHSAMIAPPITE